MLVLQPQLNDGPACLATWLREQGIAYALCSVEAGDTVPAPAHCLGASPASAPHLYRHGWGQAQAQAQAKARQAG